MVCFEEKVVCVMGWVVIGVCGIKLVIKEISDDVEEVEIVDIESEENDESINFNIDKVVLFVILCVEGDILIVI